MGPDKTVLITGCSQGGLGDELAGAFYACGLRVTAACRNLPRVEDLKDLGVETVTLDVTSHELIEHSVQQVSGITGGSLDILLNNAGGGHHLPSTDVSIDAARELFDLNVWAVLG